jgi:hypothetical protein
MSGIERERGIKRRMDGQKKSDSHRWELELLEVNQERRGRYLKGQIFVRPEWNVLLLPSRTHRFFFSLSSFDAAGKKKKLEITS